MDDNDHLVGGVEVRSKGHAAPQHHGRGVGGHLVVARMKVTAKPR
jgi:hypothetical protein